MLIYYQIIPIFEFNSQFPLRDGRSNQHVILSIMPLCNCPQSAEIPTIGAVTCLERFGEIQKVIVQRTYNGAVLNTIVIGTDDPTLLATWNALKGASDSTKVQITPYINEVENDDPDPREAASVGVGGVAAILGDDFSNKTGYFHDIPQSIMKEIRKYNCERGTSVFLVNEHGQIGGIADDNTSATTFRGIPTARFHAGQKIFGGRNDVDKNRITWSYFPDFSDEFYVIDPAFNPLLEL